MSSAYTRELLSHPKEDARHSLVAHLTNVGKAARDLYCRSGFGNPDVPFYAGLLHDVGKINPFYQDVFNADSGIRGHVKSEAAARHLRVHAPLSAWAAKHLLHGTGLAAADRDRVLALIYRHHSALKRRVGRPSHMPGDDAEGNKFIRTTDATAEALPALRAQSAGLPALAALDWDRCTERFGRPVSFGIDLGEDQAGGDSVDAYLDMSFAFSCLLQADRGSFRAWSVPAFDVNLRTETQARGGALGKIRTDFQRQAAAAFDPDEPISVINAPTGIGKTKVFLDIMRRYSGRAERVFYFSPLLALTEDFESKIRENVVPKERYGDVLVYNHIYSGSLRDREEGRTSNKWVFENESFNRQFIIATTQRLLMTIYSNTARDKMKMASFVNSVLVVDEIQTIPKPVLANLVQIFTRMSKRMNTRFVLVSATVPHEMRGLNRVAVSESTRNEYLLRTRKRVAVGPLDIASFPGGRVLAMANTRKKAAGIYGRVLAEHAGRHTLYLSAGIRKRDRSRIISGLKSENDFVLVATQVVEAGVDISFTRVYREMAPLDSIVQAMGRLNREGEVDDPLMFVYLADGDHRPYSRLEFEASSKVMRRVSDSVGLYGSLDGYYRDVSDRNRTGRSDAADLEYMISMMDFDGVWRRIKELAMPDSGGDTVFVPDAGEYDSAKSDLLAGNPEKWTGVTASLPVRPNAMADMFDRDLFEKGILLPNRESLEDIYDSNLGLDKWRT